MEPKTRMIGGIEVRKPTSVMSLDAVRDALVSQGTEAALRAIEREIEHRWVVDGYWQNVTLVPVFD